MAFSVHCSYDGNKKIKGIKQHVVADKNSFLLAAMIRVTYIHANQAAVWLMKVLKESYARA